MECQAILQNELHEKYILDQLDGPEKAEYEAHLDQCKTCKTELENQQALIAGIREAGRDEMKTEIRRQVEILEINRPGINWGTLSRIAAVLFILVLTPSVIYYLRKSEPQMVPRAELQFQITPKERDHSDAAAKTPDVEQEFRTEKNKQAKTAETEKHVAPIPTLPSAGKAASAPVVPENEDLIVKEEGQTPVSEARVASEPVAVPEPQRQAEKLNERRDEVAPSAIGDYRSTRTYVYEATKEGLKKRQVLPQNKSMAVVSPPERQMVSELRFVSNARTVLVHLKAPTGEPARVTFSRDKNVQLPESFAVEIITQDSLKLEMNWFATPGFLQVNPAGMKIEILNGETMKIFVSEEFVYQIELSNNPTKAFLVK